MLSDSSYEKILNFFDQKFYCYKTDETNWNYWGRVLDYYFDNSVYCVDYLSVEDYFDVNGGLHYSHTERFDFEYGDLVGDDRLQLIQNVLNLIKVSTFNQSENMNLIRIIAKVLSRDDVIVNNPDNDIITVQATDIIDSGSYCDIVRVSDCIVRKELRRLYKEDVKLQKRMKYEFENMKKLCACPQILKVFDYNENEFSYHMEKADMNLYKYLESKPDISFEERLSIVRDVLYGVKYAHDNDIIHRDLHLGNILRIGKNFVISDFGLSKDLSIVRSMKSSYTQKNNHYFVDPVGMSDFRLLDLKSDIYSIGKIIDYIFTCNKETSHIFNQVVERCTCRDRNLRYSSVLEVIEDINNIVDMQTTKVRIELLICKICENQYDVFVHNYILELVKEKQLSKFIVKHKLFTFWQLLLKFDVIYQKEILNSIKQDYIDATGYCGWENYDIFASISYHLYLNLTSPDLKEISKSILEGCARVRYKANDLLNKLMIS